MPDTPENVEYLVFGLVIAATILGIFISSMISRYRNLQKDIQVMEKLSEGE